MQVVVSTVLTLLLTSFSLPANAGGEDSSVPETLGFVEWVVLSDSGLRLKARLDTGARTSSLHATDIKPFEKDGERWVRFRIPLGDHKDQPNPDGKDHEDVTMTFSEPVERTVLVKRKGAESQHRYVINLSFCIAGTSHTTQFSLTNRENFSYPVLLGRRFMSDDNILIDSSDGFIAEKECPHKTLGELAKLDQAD